MEAGAFGGLPNRAGTGGRVMGARGRLWLDQGGSFFCHSPPLPPKQWLPNPMMLSFRKDIRLLGPTLYPSVISSASHPPPKGLTTSYQENRPPLLLPGEWRSGNSLLITAVVISDFNWQQRELNWSPLRAASSTRQTLSLLSCGTAMRLSILN